MPQTLNLEAPQSLCPQDSYEDIFELRADAYHSAMELCPGARDAEFEAVVSLADLQPGAVIADVPSGGGYLERYIPDPLSRLIAVEPSRQFYSRCQTSKRLAKVFSPLEKLAIDNQSIDAIVSLAGLHHVQDRGVVFRELHRILVRDGLLCIADVECGSPVDRFLNQFVDKYNSMGHAGLFIDSRFRQDVEESGFCIEHNRVVHYNWEFSNTSTMVEFCTLLFGLDRASPEIVLNGLQQYLGFSLAEGGCQLNWSLELMRCRKEP